MATLCWLAAASPACWTLATSRASLALSSSWRSEEHTSELQSRFDLVCRLLLEKKKSLIFISFFLSCSGDHRDLHSFPTRRSSDLVPSLGYKSSFMPWP